VVTLSITLQKYKTVNDKCALFDEAFTNWLSFHWLFTQEGTRYAWF